MKRFFMAGPRLIAIGAPRSSSLRRARGPPRLVSAGGAPAASALVTTRSVRGSSALLAPGAAARRPGSSEARACSLSRGSSSPPARWQRRRSKAGSGRASARVAAYLAAAAAAGGTPSPVRWSSVARSLCAAGIVRPASTRPRSPGDGAYYTAPPAPRGLRSCAQTASGRAGPNPSPDAAAGRSCRTQLQDAQRVLTMTDAHEEARKIIVHPDEK